MKIYIAIIFDSQLEIVAAENIGFGIGSKA